MSQFSGKQDFTGPLTTTDGKGVVLSRRQNKGVMQRRREEKRLEAEVRAESVKHNRTRRHRLGKCNPSEHLLQEIFSGTVKTEIKQIEDLLKPNGNV